MAGNDWLSIPVMLIQVDDELYSSRVVVHLPFLGGLSTHYIEISSPIHSLPVHLINKLNF